MAMLQICKEEGEEEEEGEKRSIVKRLEGRGGFRISHQGERNT